MQALVYKSTGSWNLVKDEAGKMWKARIKGALRIDGITSTNPVAVGDRVTIEVEAQREETAVIVSVLQRNNYVVRQSPANKNQRHIIAANIDQSMLICTVKEPKTSQGFIDRFLVSCEAYHVPAILIFNKSDLYSEKELNVFEKLRKQYEAIGYPVLLISAKHGHGTNTLQSLLKNKTTLLSGHSGVGKSSIINHLFPDFELRTQSVSGWSGKGMHTTTFSEMFDLPSNEGKIIDTPGLREFALTDISRNELSHYFPEMRNLINHCQFNNCIHIKEPGCAVKEAVEQQRISSDRYHCYLHLLETL